MLDVNSALKNLKELNTIFEKNDVPYWIQDGTLLGYYRDKNFIEHDNDLDIGVRWQDFSREIMLDILNQGFELYAVSGLTHDSLVINVIKRNISIDFYCYYKTESGIYHSALIKKPYADGRYRVDYSYKNFSIKEAYFLDCKCYVPEDELYFLETKYGKNWNIPNDKWISSVDPLNRTQTNITVKKKRSRKDFFRWLEQTNE